MIPDTGNDRREQLPRVVMEDLERICTSLGEPMRRLRGERILVTGAGGMIASYLIHTLLHMHRLYGDGPEIVAVVRNPDAARRQFSYIIREGLERKIHWVELDLRESRAWEGAATYYIHAASPASPAACAQDPIGTALVNTAATQRLLAWAAHRNARRFLFFSSSEIYGNPGPGEHFVRETDLGILDPLGPRAIYPESKRMGETLCMAWARVHNVPVNIARIFHTYGPGMRLDDDRVYADFTAKVLRGEPITLKSAGTGRRAFCYLADTVAGLLTILLHGQPGEAYNVGNPDAVLSVRELAELLAPMVPEGSAPLPVTVAEEHATPQSPSATVFPNIEKLKQLGWQPTITPREGFQRTLASFRESTKTDA